ncbi:MAG TPA: hypothetical protein VJX74_03535, partial [Blastocatellia bacterium]|nr:hypothetical protein [Blastocatellia bacterium]
MMITRKYLPRRTFLKGMGTAIALPMLDAMVPAMTTTNAAAPVRLSMVYVPNGIVMKDWTPKTVGKE